MKYRKLCKNFVMAPAGPRSGIPNQGWNTRTTARLDPRQPYPASVSPCVSSLFWDSWSGPGWSHNNIFALLSVLHSLQCIPCINRQAWPRPVIKHRARSGLTSPRLQPHRFLDSHIWPQSGYFFHPWFRIPYLAPTGAINKILHRI